MSLPTTAAGPLKVETKPILIVSAAAAGCAKSCAETSAAAPASQNAVLMWSPSSTCAHSPAFARRDAFGFWLPCFVRETAPRRQERTDGSLFEPSDHAPKRHAP